MSPNECWDLMVLAGAQTVLEGVPYASVHVPEGVAAGALEHAPAATQAVIDLAWEVNQAGDTSLDPNSRTALVARLWFAAFLVYCAPMTDAQSLEMLGELNDIEDALEAFLPEQVEAYSRGTEWAALWAELSPHVRAMLPRALCHE